MNASPVDQMIKGCISWVVAAKPGALDMTTACSRKTLVTVGWPVYDHGGGLKRTVVDSHMCVELEA